MKDNIEAGTDLVRTIRCNTIEGHYTRIVYGCSKNRFKLEQLY